MNQLSCDLFVRGRCGCIMWDCATAAVVALVDVAAVGETALMLRLWLQLMWLSLAVMAVA